MDWRPRGINRELASEISRELALVTEKQLFQFANVVKLPAIGQNAVRVHRQRVMKSKFLAAFGDALRQFTFRLRAVARAPATHYVKVLECKSGRVDFGVAGVAGLQRAMFIEL